MGGKKRLHLAHYTSLNLLMNAVMTLASWYMHTFLVLRRSQNEFRRNKEIKLVETTRSEQSFTQSAAFGD